MPVKIEIRDKQLVIDGQKLPLLSGEIHYWRLNPDHWSKVLDRAREMGLRIIATYVPWQYHEYEDEKLDFHGKTAATRNLVGFLDLLEAQDFWIIIRPGPYIYSEWVNSGPPRRAAKYHRLHPEFLKAAEWYIREVTAVLKPYFVTRGGRILLLQPDNEIDPSYGWFEEQIGMGQAAGSFQEFLRERYGDIDALNRAWGADYHQFSEAGCIAHDSMQDDRYRRRFLDFQRFKHWYVLKYAQWVVDQFKKAGVEVPLYLNTYPVVDPQPWRELQELVDIVGPDLYPSNEFTKEPHEHRQFLERIRYERTFARVPYLPEFEAGVWHGHQYWTGVTTPNHYQMSAVSALAAGIAGWNWYMLVNRDNWYMSPINEWGRKHLELYEVFAKILRVFHTINPPELEKLTNTAVTFYGPHHQTHWLGNEDPTLLSLYNADIDYEFFDVDTGSIHKPLLFYSGLSWMSRAGQERLLRYVEGGGHLVFFKSFPFKDDRFDDLNLLELKLPEVITNAYFKNLRVQLGNQNVTVRGSVFNYRDVPGEPLVGVQQPWTGHHLEEMETLFNLQVGMQFTIGYREKRGKGSITLLGANPTTELLTAVHQSFGIEIPARSLTPGIHTALFRGASGFYLMAVNTDEAPKAAQVLLSPKVVPVKRVTVTDLFTEKQWPWAIGDEQPLTIPLERKSGSVFQLS